MDRREGGGGKCKCKWMNKFFGRQYTGHKPYSLKCNKNRLLSDFLSLIELFKVLIKSVQGLIKFWFNILVGSMNQE